MIQRTRTGDQEQPSAAGKAEFPADLQTDLQTDVQADVQAAPKAEIPAEVPTGISAERGRAADVEPLGGKSAEVREPLPAVDAAVVAQVEAMLFVSTEPLPTRRISDLLGEEGETVRQALAALEIRHSGRGSGIQLTQIAGGWRLLTRPEHADALAALSGRNAQDSLSPAALETLAIAAYKQPVGRAEIERIRGVGVGPILRHLLELDLIKVTGREEGLGRALLYGTTRCFLDRFGLKSIRDLPASLEL